MKYEAEKILLVEDNLVNCEVAVDMLETTGFEVDVANNGQQALDLYKANYYKLILMDYEMPVMNGLLAAKAIREVECERLLPSIEKTPIIALTAHATSSVKRQCIASGMDDFLGKPFNLSDLRLLFFKWLGADIKSEFLPPSSIINKRVPSGDINDIESDWSILCFDVLKRYYVKQKKDGSNLVRNVVRTYLEQSSGLLIDLSEAVKKNDIESVRFISHTLKSSSMNVGAPHLAESCRAVELTCGQKYIEKALVHQIYKNYSDAEKALRDVLDNIAV